MNNLRFGSFACLVALLLIIFGCGGGGGGGSTGTSATGSSATAGGGSDNLTLAYDMKGFTGKLTEDVVRSSTPQTVRISVNGTVRTISNVIVSETLSADDDLPVVMLSEGSKLLNATIPNASAGVGVGDLTIKAPVSGDGILQASVLGGRSVANLVTPPATWQGFSFANGLKVLFFKDSAEGDQRVQINAAIKFPKAPGNLAGTVNYVYTSPSGFSSGATFSASDLSDIRVGGSKPAPATNGTSVGDWHSTRTSNEKPVFTAATITSD